MSASSTVGRKNHEGVDAMFFFPYRPIFFIKLNQLPSLSLSSQIYQHLAYLPWYTIIRYSPLPQLDVFQHMSQAIILSFHTSLLSLVLELLLLHLEIECGIQQLYCCLVYLQLLLHKNMYLLV